jgi:diguanylate cyclase (GGDEF) domain
MGKNLFACLILILSSVNALAITDFEKVIEESRALAGEDPQKSISLLDSLKNSKEPVPFAIELEADMIRCEYFVDNDDARKSIEIATSWKEKKIDLSPLQVVKIDLCKGTAMEKLGDSVGARKTYLETLSLARLQGLKEQEGEALLNVGQLQSFKGEFTEALESLQTAHSVFNDLKLDNKVRITLNSIAILYGRMGENKRSLEYYTQVLAQNKALGKKRNIAVVLYNMGRRYEELKEFPKALSSYQEALVIHSELKNEVSVALVERSIGSVYNAINKPALALKHLEVALDILQKKSIVKSQGQVYLEMGLAYRHLKKHDLSFAAFDKAEKALKSTASPSLERDLWEQRSLLYVDKLDWKHAYESYVEFKKSSDSILGKQRDEQLAHFQVRFDTAQKEQINQRLMHENELQEQRIQASTRIQSLQLAVISLGCLLFGLVGWFAVRQVKLAQRMKDLALTDELTKVPNRRHILTYGEEVLKACSNQQKAFSVLVLDIDHFKKINDTYGHAIGDEVIKRVASLVKGSLRKGDNVGRIGGEEFLVVLPATTSDEAQEIGERIRAQIAFNNMGDIQAGMRVTISVGIASDTLSKRKLDVLMNMADEALYEVKENGRNGVRLNKVA